MRPTLYLKLNCNQMPLPHVHSARRVRLHLGAELESAGVIAKLRR